MGKGLVGARAVASGRGRSRPHASPCVSVIMPMYDEPLGFIAESVDSIISQSFRNWELIAVLDKPDNDEIAKAMDAYARKDKRIVFLRNKTNLGRGAARNRAVKIARGEYIAILDADDVALKDRLSLQVRFMDDHPGTDVLFGGADFIDYKGKVIRHFRPTQEDFRRIKRIIFSKHVTIHSTMMIKAGILKALLYDPEFLRGQDFDFFVRCICEGKRFDVLEKVLVRYRMSVGDYDLRIRKQRNVYKYGLKSLLKNWSCFGKTLGGYWTLLRLSVSYAAISAVPKAVLKLFMKVK